MKDVFNLGSLAKRDIKDLSNICGSAHAGTEHEAVAKSAANAINCHDDLVSSFAKVMEEYWLSVPDTAEEFEVRPDVIAARSIIAKATVEK